MPWQLSILVHSLLSAGRSIQNRRIGKNSYDISLYALFVTFLMVSVLGLILGFTQEDPVVASDAWSARWYLVAAGTCFATLNFLSFKLFRLLPASVVAITSLLNPTAVVVVAAAFTAETLTTQQWIGSAVLLLAVMLVQLRHTNKKNSNGKLSIGLSASIILLVALLFGIGIVTEKYLLDRIGLSTYLVFGWGGQFVSVSVLVFLLRKNFRLPDTWKMHGIVFSSALFLSVGGFFFVKTQVSSDSASLTSVSSSVKVLLTVLLAFIFLKERDRMIQKFIALALSCAGLFLLFT